MFVTLGSPLSSIYAEIPKGGGSKRDFHHLRNPAWQHLRRNQYWGGGGGGRSDDVISTSCLCVGG